jgi:hypothetical protein
LQLAPEFVVTGELTKVIVQSEAVQNVGVGTERDPRLAVFHRAQGGTLHSSALGHELHREPASQPGEPNILAQLAEEPTDSWMRRRGLPRHNGLYFVPKRVI